MGKHSGAQVALLYWLKVSRKARWGNLAEVRRDFQSADLVGDRLVFNIKGNSYRLVAGVSFERQALYVKWFGAHAEYDRIDVRKVEPE